MITLHVKSNALDAFRSAGSSAHGKFLGVPAVEDCALPGAFGGKAINLLGARAIQYLPRLNLPSGAFTMLMRYAPDAGNVGVMMSISNGVGAWYAGMRINNNAGDNPGVLIRNTNGDIVVNENVGILGSVVDEFGDFWLAWDGLPGAGKIKTYFAPNGQLPTLISAQTALYAASRDTAVSGSMILGQDAYANGFKGRLGELVFWDAALDPVSFGVRTDFIPDTANDGSNTTDLQPNLVAAGEVYYVRGDRRVGTLDNVTNVIGNHALEGSELDGILEATS